MVSIKQRKKWNLYLKIQSLYFKWNQIYNLIHILSNNAEAHLFHFRSFQPMQSETLN